MPSSTTSRKRGMTKDEHNEGPTTKRLRGTSQIDSGEEVDESTMIQQRKNSTKTMKGIKRSVDADDSDAGFEEPSAKRQRKKPNELSHATNTTVQLSKNPQLENPSKRQFEDDCDSLEQSSLKRQKSNLFTSNDATKTSTNQQSSQQKFMQLPKFTKLPKRRAETHSETQYEGPAAERQMKEIILVESKVNVSMTRRPDSTTLRRSTKRGAKDNNTSGKSNEPRQTPEKQTQKRASTMGNNRPQNPGKMISNQLQQGPKVQGHERALDVFQDGSTELTEGEDLGPAGKVRKLTSVRNNEPGPQKKSQNQTAAPGSRNNKIKSSLTTENSAEKLSQQFVATDRNVAKNPFNEGKSFNYKPARKRSAKSEPEKFEAKQIRPETSSYQILGRRKDKSSRNAAKASNDSTSSLQESRKKRKSQDAPAGRVKRQRMDCAQLETAPPKPFLERLPREIRDMIYAELLGQGRKVYCLNPTRAEELRTEQVQAPIRVQERIDDLQAVIDQFSNYPPFTIIEDEIRGSESEQEVLLSGLLNAGPTIRFVDTTIFTTCRQINDEALHSLLTKNPIHVVPELEIEPLRSRDCLHYSPSVYCEQVVKFDDTVNHVLLTARNVSMRVTVDMVPILVRVLRQRSQNGTPDLQSMYLWHTWHEFKSHEDFHGHLYPLRRIRAQKFSFEFCELDMSQGYGTYSYNSSTENSFLEEIELSPATKGSIEKLKSHIEKTGPRPQNESFAFRYPW